MTKTVYHLPKTKERNCDIKVYEDRVEVEGEFWNLREKEFYKNPSQKDVAYIRDFIGMGYLKKRSHKKGIFFVICAAILEVLHIILDKIGDISNGFHLMGMELYVPVWIENSVNVMLVIAGIFAIMYLFSQKSVIEISFLNKRICIPRKCLTNNEFQNLYATLLRLKQ